MRDEKGLFELTMLVEVHGALSPAREYAHQGKVYVEGIDGACYALRVCTPEAYILIFIA